MKRYFDKQSDGSYLMRPEHLPNGHSLRLVPRWRWHIPYGHNQQYEVEHTFWRQCPVRRKRKTVVMAMGWRGLHWGSLGTAHYWAKIKAEWLRNAEEKKQTKRAA